MALPASGVLSLSEITEEIFGVGVTGKSLAECGVAAGFTAPYSITDFYSYSHTWGRMYVQADISFTAYIYSASQGYDLLTGTDTLVYTADRANESIYVYKSTTPTNITAGDAVRIAFYRRAAGSSDTWVLNSGWNNYATATYSPHTFDFTLYDIKCVVMSNI